MASFADISDAPELAPSPCPACQAPLSLWPPSKLLAIVSPPPPSPKHVIAGSLAAVAAGYLRSAAFANLSLSSQASYRVALKPILAAHGHRLVRELPKMAARHIIEEIGATRPGMANLTRAVLSNVIAYAIETGLRADNPFAGLKAYRLGQRGWILNCTSLTQPPVSKFWGRMRLKMRSVFLLSL
jgi:hypothetical protein